MALETIGETIASPSSMPRRCMIELRRSLAKIRIKSSSRLRKNLDSPESPWRPERPRNWLSIRRDSWRSVPTTYRPPPSLDPGPRIISVPRPAMLVEIVTRPESPASLMMIASRAWFLAFKISCSTPRFFNRADSSSLFSTETVPTSTGWPRF